MIILKSFHKKEKSCPAKLGRAEQRAFATYMALVLCVFCFSTPAFAADDPLAIVNNLSDFVFSLIRAVGIILLGWGVVQVGWHWYYVYFALVPQPLPQTILWLSLTICPILYFPSFAQ